MDGAGARLGLDHGRTSRLSGCGRRDPSGSELSPTSPTAPRKMIEPMTLIWTGSALRWIE